MSKRTDLAGVVAGSTLKRGINKRYAREVAAYVLDNRMTNQVDSLLRDVRSSWADAGQLEVLAYSAFPLSSSIKSEIRRQVKLAEPAAKEIVITEVYDPEVIGGVRISLPGKQLDLSVSAKLNKFKTLVSEGKE